MPRLCLFVAADRSATMMRRVIMTLANQGRKFLKPGDTNAHVSTLMCQIST